MGLVDKKANVNTWGGKCDEDSYLAYVEKLELIPEPVNGTNHICEALNQVSENVFSNFTCFLEDSQVMISDFVSVCAYDFSSTSRNISNILDNLF